MNLNKPTYVACMAIVLAVMAVSTRAQQPQEKDRVAKPAFAELDQDGDGLISLSEAQEKDTWVASKFQTLDADRDGYISKSEYEKFVG